MLLVRLGLRDALLPAAPVAPDWTDDERKAWQKFLSTEAGTLLWQRLRAVECLMASKMVTDTKNTLHSAGRAAGFAECRAYLESLSRASRVTEAPDTQSDDQRAETELRELYSA